VAFGGEFWAGGVWDTLDSLTDAVVAAFASGQVEYVANIGPAQATFGQVPDYMAALRNSISNKGYQSIIGCAPETGSWRATFTKVA